MLNILTVILLCALSVGCSSLLFHPSKELVNNLVAEQFKPEDVNFQSEDGEALHGWLFRARAELGTVLVMHGNAENLSTQVNSVLWLVKEGFNLFIFDYRGFGRSSGSAEIHGVHRDARAALRFVSSVPSLSQKGIAVLGQSIGAAIAIHTVALSPERQFVKMVIVDSPFSGYRSIAREKLAGFFLTWPFQYPLSYLLNDLYSPDRWISSIAPRPLLIITDSSDNIVPPHHGKILFSLARQPKEFILTDGLGHTGSFADENVRKRISETLRSQLSAPQSILE